MDGFRLGNVHWEPMVTLSTFTVGDGPILTVLLHGILGSGRNLRTLAAKWSARDPARRIIVPDLLGHGDSPPLQASSGLRELAVAVIETVGAIASRAGPASFVGHSLGARVALAVAREDSARVRDVVLLDMSPGPLDSGRLPAQAVLEALLKAPERVEDRRTMRSALTEAGLDERIADWLMMNLSRKGTFHEWRIDRRAVADLHHAIAAESLWPEVESGRFPVRCIRGQLSPFVTERDIARMEAAGCSVLTLPGAGHDVHVDALDALVDALAS